MSTTMITHQATPLRNSKGFSLIELTIATAILSVMLVVITQVFIGIIRQNTAAISVQASTQYVRNAFDDITTQARLSDHVQIITNSADTSNTANPTSFDQICLFQGNKLTQYFAINQLVNNVGTRVLYRYTQSVDANGAMWTPTGGQYPVCYPITNIPNGAVPVITTGTTGSSSATGTADSNLANVGVSDLEAQVSPEIALGSNPAIIPGSIPTLTVRIGITTDLKQQYPNATKSCTTNLEYCSITTMESSVSLRETQSNSTSSVQSAGL